MKAPSIRQRWAWLIVNGHKDIENRAWPTKFRGRVLIHASKGMTRGGASMTSLTNLLCCFYALVAIGYGVAGNPFALTFFGTCSVLYLLLACFLSFTDCES
jgi:ASCH domain